MGLGFSSPVLSTLENQVSERPIAARAVTSPQQDWVLLWGRLALRCLGFPNARAGGPVAGAGYVLGHPWLTAGVRQGEAPRFTSLCPCTGLCPGGGAAGGFSCSQPSQEQLPGLVLLLLSLHLPSLQSSAPRAALLSMLTRQGLTRYTDIFLYETPVGNRLIVFPFHPRKTMALHLRCREGAWLSPGEGSGARAVPARSQAHHRPSG